MARGVRHDAHPERAFSVPESVHPLLESRPRKINPYIHGQIGTRVGILRLQRNFLFLPYVRRLGRRSGLRQRRDSDGKSQSYDFEHNCILSSLHEDQNPDNIVVHKLGSFPNSSKDSEPNRRQRWEKPEGRCALENLTSVSRFRHYSTRRFSGRTTEPCTRYWAARLRRQDAPPSFGSTA